MLKEIVKDGSAVGSGILLYKLLDKYGDTQVFMPWRNVAPQVELSNTVGFIDFLVSMLVARYGGLAEAYKTWIYEHGIAAGLSALIGLFFTPVMYISQMPPITIPTKGQALAGAY